MLTIYTNQPVIDESGLKEGGYCTADEVDPLSALGPEMDTGGSIFTAIEDVWGYGSNQKRRRWI